MLKNLVSLFVIFLSFLACGEDNAGISSSVSGEARTVVIVDLTFAPSHIIASAGDLIYFYNDDGIPHHILNESAEDQFDDTGLFDSFIIDLNDTRFITIPDTALPGEIFYFYCDLMKDVMTTPNGSITIE